jgi:hypothetical protein
VGTNVQEKYAITRVATIVIIAANCGNSRAIAANWRKSAILLEQKTREFDGIVSLLALIFGKDV